MKEFQNPNATKIHVAHQVMFEEERLSVCKVEGVYHNQMHDSIKDYLEYYTIPEKFAMCEELVFIVIEDIEFETGYYNVKLHLNEGIVY